VPAHLDVCITTDCDARAFPVRSVMCPVPPVLLASCANTQLGRQAAVMYLLLGLVFYPVAPIRMGEGWLAGITTEVAHLQHRKDFA